MMDWIIAYLIHFSKYKEILSLIYYYCFNQFFVDKIAKIRSSLPVIQPNVRAIVSSPTSLESLHPASVSEVEKIIARRPTKRVN